MSLPFQPVKPVRGGRPLDDLYVRLAADPKWVVEAKMDGQRAVWDPTVSTSGNAGTLWSRRDLPIWSPDVIEVLNRVTHEIDGEYIPVKGKRGKGVYWVFDLPEHRGHYTLRRKALAALVKRLKAPGLIRLCPAEVTWADVALHGWEGVVLKRRSSKYPKSMSPNTTTPAWVKYRAEWL